MMKRNIRIVLAFLLLGPTPLAGETLRLESRWLTLQVDSETGRWSLLDARSGVRWPSRGQASAGTGEKLQGAFSEFEVSSPDRLRLAREDGAAVVFEISDRGRTLTLRYESEGPGEVRALGEALTMDDTDGGHAIVPCREGLLVPADRGGPFRRTFGASDYEGSHMNMLGLVKSGSALIVSWDGAQVFPELSRTVDEGPARGRRLSTRLALRGSAKALSLTPLGEGDWNTVAAGYRRIAECKGLAVTLREKIRRNGRAERMVGAANVKLWTCLARRMNEESDREESVKVRWTFDEAAQIAEHLREDLGIERCLFVLGGWTEGGYDCRHPDNLPANSECGGNEALSDALRRIEKLGYVSCLHDNYQDMYRDARSWDPKFIEKNPDGSLVRGGRWLGGRAFMVCAPKQLELARRPGNLPGIHALFPASSYFIDTTYAVGPRECHDPQHPLDRNQDIAWKIRLSDYARETFGLFGSECGREWALAHSDFFEGLVGVSGRAFHNLDPADLGATVIPFWEMVYHDCQICWGKYGYAAAEAADYVAHHVLCARPLHYHSIPDHIYWKRTPAAERVVDARPRVVSVEPAGDGFFRIRYAWDVYRDLSEDWRVFVHFGRGDRIEFQDDYVPPRPTSSWSAGQSVEVGARTVRIPSALGDEAVDVYIGLFDSGDERRRARLRNGDAQNRVFAGRIRLRPSVRFEPSPPQSAPDGSCYLRSDGGWAEGLHPVDVFLKNTQEVLGPLHAATAHQTLRRLEFLSEDRKLRAATYGEGSGATRVVVNFGRTDAEVASPRGGRVLLPPSGFVADGPRFAAFYARRWRGRDYPGGALFTLRALDKRGLDDSGRLRIYHGFGDPGLPWGGDVIRVPRERIVQRAE